jgi:hypothetical protein
MRIMKQNPAKFARFPDWILLEPPVKGTGVPLLVKEVEFDCPGVDGSFPDEPSVPVPVPVPVPPHVLAPEAAPIVGAVPVPVTVLV